MSISTVTKSRATLVLHTSEGHEMTAIMARIPIEQAAEATGIPDPLLRHLIRYDVLDGSAELCDLDQAAQLADEIKAARATMEGQEILVSDAAIKYGFDRKSIYNWIRSGWVQVRRTEPRVMIEEGDLALARWLANRIGTVAGRSIFPPRSRSGRPRKPLDN